MPEAFLIYILLSTEFDYHYTHLMPATIYTIHDNIPVDLRTVKGISVVVTVPAAFSGTCTNICVPQIVEHANEIKNAGADIILIVSCDQPDAIRQWIEDAKWNKEPNIAFASDFGKFEMRNVVGKLSDEDGKSGLPPSLGELIRRGYMVIKNGTITWKYIEPNSGKYTLNMADLLEAVKAAHVS